MNNIPIGFCHCGCGKRTKIARYTYSARGYIKGQPLRYILGHRSTERRNTANDFWSHVDKSDIGESWNGTPCWHWIGRLDDMGYARFRVNGHLDRAHRIAYKLVHGKIPKQLHVLHHCDHRNCVNPDHLFLGSNFDNIADRVSKNRSAKGETHGHHKLTEQQVREIRAARDVCQYELAKRYGIAPDNISRILSGELWKHVV